jgi:hypothetical protein
MSTETQRAGFCAFLRSIGWSDSPAMRENGNYINGAVQGQWTAWQAAQAFQAAEIEALKADIAANVRAASEQAAEIEVLRKVSSEYNAWIKFQAAGHDYDEFLRTQLGCTNCKQYRDATGELVIPLCRCKAAMQTKEAS